MFGAPFNGPLVHEVVIAELAARRQGTHSTRTRGMVRGGGAKPWRQKGTGRARAGTSRSPLWTGGGTVFGPSPAPLHRQGQPQGPQGRAALRAVGARRARHDLRARRRRASTRPSTKTAVGLLEGRTGGAVLLVVVGPTRTSPAKSFRNLERVTVLPAEAVGVADLVGAAQFVVTEAALDALTARAKGTEGGEGLMDATQIIIAPIVSEKSYVLATAGKYTFRVHDDAHKTQIKQAVEELFDVKVLDVATMSVKGKPKRRGYTSGYAPLVEEGHRAGARGRQHPDLPGPGGRSLMPIKKVKPTSPGRRFATYADFAEITKTEPEKSLTEGLRSPAAATPTAARPPATAAAGPSAPTAQIDFKRTKDGVPAKVASIEYDPNRTAYIALLHYLDGEKRYIIAPQRLRVGMTVESGPGADITVGNALPLANIPVGTVVHNVELQPGRGAQLGRSAGTGIQLMAKEGGLATLRMPSVGDAPGARRVPRDRRRRSATPTTRTSTSARPAASATWACARRRAARP